MFKFLKQFYLCIFTCKDTVSMSLQVFCTANIDHKYCLCKPGLKIWATFIPTPTFQITTVVESVTFSFPW